MNIGVVLSSMVGAGMVVSGCVTTQTPGKAPVPGAPSAATPAAVTRSAAATPLPAATVVQAPKPLAPRAANETTLYFENFMMASNGFIRPAASCGWKAVRMYHFEDYFAAESSKRAANTGLPDVNSNPLSAEGAVNGGCFLSNAEYPSLLFTEEYQGADISEMREVRVQLSTSADAEFWPALRVGDAWYVAEQPIVNPAGDTASNNTFVAVGCRLEGLAWNRLIFLPREDKGRQDTLQRDEAAGRVALPPSGKVTAFGLFADRYSYQSKYAIDEFEIRGVPAKPQ